MKLLWDAIGTEFGGRHELYEIQLRRQPRGHPHPRAVQRQGLRRLRRDDRARRAVHGRLRRERLDRRYLAQPDRSRAALRMRGTAQPVGSLPAGGIHYIAGMSWIDQHPDMAGRLRGRRRSQKRRAEDVPRGDEPARRGGACHHHRRARRQDRIHRHGGVLGVGCAADAAGLPQPVGDQHADPARQRRVLRQHAAGRRRTDRRHLCRPHQGARARPASTPANGASCRPARRR